MSSLKYEIDFEETSEDGIRYRIAKEKDFDACVDMYFDSLIKHEPPSIALGGCSRHPGVIAKATSFLWNGVSIIAEDTKMGNKPVGIRLAYVLERNETKKQSEANGRTDIDKLGDIPWSYKCILALSDIVCYPQDIFDRYPDVNKIYYYFGLATHPEYRRKGIGRKMIDLSLKVAKSIGCTGCLVFTTSDISRAMFENMGMEMVSETPWDSIDVGGGRFPYRGKQVKCKAACTFFLRI